MKPTRLNTAILLSRVVIHGFVAGYVQDAGEAIGEIAGKQLEKIPLLGTVVGGVAEASGHYLLIQRVGKAAQKMLRLVIKK